MTTWHDVWVGKGRTHAGESSLASLMEADGYDISVSAVTESDFVKFGQVLIERLELDRGKTVLEIGCGAGALCKVFADAGIEVVGIDYTSELVDIARIGVPSGTFHVAEADSLNLDKRDFDAVISHSVFHYFPSTQYALDAFARMIDHCVEGGIVALTDMHDASKKRAHETKRRATIGDAEYDRLYAELRHSYFDRAEFLDFANDRCAEVWIEEQFIESGSAEFKFNLLARK